VIKIVVSLYREFDFCSYFVIYNLVRDHQTYLSYLGHGHRLLTACDSSRIYLIAPTVKHLTKRLTIHEVVALDVFAGGMPKPFLLRKKSTPAFSPVAPSIGSTQPHHRIDFHRLFTNPIDPSLVSLR
jgi:hypothetical protein